MDYFRVVDDRAQDEADQPCRPDQAERDAAKPGVTRQLHEGGKRLRIGGRADQNQSEQATCSFIVEAKRYQQRDGSAERVSHQGEVREASLQNQAVDQLGLIFSGVASVVRFWGQAEALHVHQDHMGPLG